MRIATTSLHEELRLQELHATGILDTPAEQEFDELVELAAHIFGCSITAITFIDETRQWIKAAKGLDVAYTNRGDSFCTHTIEQTDVMIISDASKDDRFKQNPFVTGDASIRFYAGAPIVSGNGYNLGSICVVDKTPRTLDEHQVKMLQMISRQVSKLIELKQKAAQLKAAAASVIQTQQDMMHHTLMRHEQENFDISITLHEDLAQGLAATKLYLEMAEENGSKAYIARCKENVAKMLEDTRTLSKKLFPTTLTWGNICDMLQQQLNQFEQKTGIRTQLFCPNKKSLHPDLHLMLFRIVEEGLKNVKKHASATQVSVKLMADSHLRLSISDDGMGFDMANFKAGMGLKTVASFAEYYGGKADMDAHLHEGCKLQITVPLMQAKTSETAEGAMELKQKNSLQTLSVAS